MELLLSIKKQIKVWRKNCLLSIKQCLLIKALFNPSTIIYIYWIGFPWLYKYLSVPPHRFLKPIWVEINQDFRCLTMPFSKQLFGNFSVIPIQGNEMSELFSNYKPQYDDDVMECLQFGICSTRPVPPSEIPYFHFWKQLFLYNFSIITST